MPRLVDVLAMAKDGCQILFIESRVILPSAPRLLLRARDFPLRMMHAAARHAMVKYGQRQASTTSDGGLLTIARSPTANASAASIP